MKKRSLLLLSAIAGIALMFTVGVLYAGTTVSDMIKMENPAYETHTKGIVEFSHKKHAEEYGATCGECHHDDKGQPLELKDGDDVQSCIACHKKPGEAPKGKDAPKLSKQEKLEYHAEALHQNCKECHKDFNKKNNTKTAPTTCTQCHPKTK